MANDLREFFNEQNIASAYLVGHSMGGKTAMEFALSYPASVKKLAVIDMPPGATESRHDYILQALSNLNLLAFSSREDIDASLQEEIPDLAIRQFLLTNLKRGEDGSFSWKMNLDSIQQNYGEINRGIPLGREYRGPVLFMRENGRRTSVKRICR